MKNKKSIIALICLIGIIAIVASSMGIFSSGGPGSFEYVSIRGETVTIYGEGLYRDMSAEVAPQGIAQDYITLFLSIPILFMALYSALKGSLKGRIVLAGTLGYFLVTYLFYLVMAMYNELFLGYVILLGTSFFAFSLVMLSFNLQQLPGRFHHSLPVKPTGGFLIFNSLAIGLLWMGVVVPPLLDGSIIPAEVEHYTTLIVQGLDLSILLPLAFVSGVLFIRKNPMGFLLAPVYFTFLSLMMLALTAKVIAMGMLGQNIIPVIFIIPLFAILSITCTVVILKNIKD